MESLSLQANYIDLLIIAIIALYVFEGLERGFWVLVGDLLSFLGSLAIALRFYSDAAGLLSLHFNIPPSFANAIGFILVAMFSQTLLSNLVRRGLQFIPENWRVNWWSRGLSTVPAIIDSGILIAVFLTLLISIPISPKIKADVLDSKIGGFLVSNTTRFEKTITNIFGGAFEDTLTFLTVRPGTDQRIDINYKPSELTIDQVSEARMLELVNAERAKVGAKPLIVDSTIVAVARAHSRDMWERGYFSHTNPDGETPFDRMRAGGVRFATAGENLALAPTVELAHQGLMNSPGHRRNILDPNFGRIGIGTIDGDIYGKMYTQNFAD